MKLRNSVGFIFESCNMFDISWHMDSKRQRNVFKVDLVGQSQNPADYEKKNTELKELLFIIAFCYLLHLTSDEGWTNAKIRLHVINIFKDDICSGVML